MKRRGKFGPFRSLSVRRDAEGRRSLSFDPGAVIKSVWRRRRRKATPPGPK